MKRITFSLVLAVATILPGSHFLSVSHARVDEARDVSYAQDWRVTGPSGGDVRALVVDPNDPEHFYFGTLDGQIYTSTDGARNWRLLVNFQRPRLFVDHIITR